MQSWAALAEDKPLKGREITGMPQLSAGEWVWFQSRQWGLKHLILREMGLSI